MLPPLDILLPGLISIEPLALDPRLHRVFAKHGIIAVFSGEIIVVEREGDVFQPLDGLVPLAETHVLRADEFGERGVVLVEVGLQELVEFVVGGGVSIVEIFLRTADIEGVEVETRASTK